MDGRQAFIRATKVRNCGDPCRPRIQETHHREEEILKFLTSLIFLCFPLILILILLLN